MTHIITSLCLRDGACVEVCPVECIVPGIPEAEWPWYFIDPDTCIDCAACETVCPVTAIFHEDDVPAEWKQYIEINRAFFKDTPAQERTFRPRTERTAGG